MGPQRLGDGADASGRRLEQLADVQADPQGQFDCPRGRRARPAATVDAAGRPAREAVASPGERRLQGLARVERLLHLRVALVESGEPPPPGPPLGGVTPSGRLPPFGGAPPFGKLPPLGGAPPSGNVPPLGGAPPPGKPPPPPPLRFRFGRSMPCFERHFVYFWNWAPPGPARAGARCAGVRRARARRAGPAAASGEQDRGGAERSEAGEDLVHVVPFVARSCRRLNGRRSRGGHHRGTRCARPRPSWSSTNWLPSRGAVRRWWRAPRSDRRARHP